MRGLAAIPLTLAALWVASAASAGTQPRSEILWGAYVGGGQYGLADAPWDMRSANAFERNTGKRMSLLEWGQAWVECSDSCGWRPFRTGLFRRAHARGYLPVLSWGSYQEQRGANQPRFRLAEIASGRYDPFIRRWARGAARWGHPFFLRFDWEMNTNRVPY